MPQLDGLRTLAVAAVVVHHYVSPDAAVQVVDWGGMGVRLFFVLSGFLITGILLADRGAVDAGRKTRAQAIKQFFLRRTLRIFPLYYFILLLALLFNVGDIRRSIAWYALYLTNVRMAVLADNGITLAHFWTLAVEEQFYLVWPWLILFLPRRALLPVLLAGIAAAPVFRVIGQAVRLNQVAINALPLSSLDSLGLGSLLAYLRATRQGHQVDRFAVGCLLVGSALLATQYTVATPEHPMVYFGLVPMAFPLMATWFIHRAARGFGGVAGAALASTPMTALGRISYGLYVYHGALMALLPAMTAAAGYPIMHILDKAFGWTGITPSTTPATAFGFLFWTSLTVVVSAASWMLLEKPINRLKERLR
jgi:peptidoglycan/LPS O-acetylase OafA/YrhL